jgi:hypothetical protein
LHQAIEDLHCQPAQEIDELIRLFRQRSGPSGSGGLPDTLNMDARLRPIGRNLDDAAQRDDYSRKHHRHHLKNTVLCDEYHHESLTKFGVQLGLSSVREISNRLAQACHATGEAELSIQSDESLAGKRVVIALDGGRTRTREYNGKLPYEI